MPEQQSSKNILLMILLLYIYLFFSKLRKILIDNIFMTSLKGIFYTDEIECPVSLYKDKIFHAEKSSNQVNLVLLK